MSSPSIIRPLEGMRAVAILAVLLFHVDLEFCPGGFLGVDLFFVISGFIISRNIIEGIGAQQFSFRTFYLKRYLRLFPSLFTTLLVTLVVGWFVLTPTPLGSLGESAVFTALSLANVHFWMQTGYFDAAAETKPLLHMWSLGVEEQFYLFWPALLVLVQSKKWRLALISGLFVLSCGSSFFLSYQGNTAPFFMLPFRIYQFMAGAVLAVGGFRLTGPASSAAAAFGIIAFAIFSVRLDQTMDTTLAGMGAGLVGVLLIAGRESPLSQRVLGNPLFFWIGQRSYVTYLVHWPLIVLYKEATDFELDLAEQLTLLGTSMLLGEVLHRLVEAPFRIKHGVRGFTDRIAVPFTTLLVLVCTSAAWSSWKTEGFVEYRGGAALLEVTKVVAQVEAQSVNRHRMVRVGDCHLRKDSDFESFNREKCARLSSKKRNVLILGNSMAADTYMLLAPAFPHVHFLQATGAGCIVSQKEMPSYLACQELNRYRLNELPVLKLDEIVLAATWGDEEMEGLDEVLERLVHLTKARIVLFGKRAQFSRPAPLLLEAHGALSGFDEFATARVDLFPETNKRLAELADKYEIEFFDIAHLQCPKSCTMIGGGKLYYRDAVHLVPEGAEYLRTQLLRSDVDFVHRWNKRTLF